jgi:hypothetical protein
VPARAAYAAQRFAFSKFTVVFYGAPIFCRKTAQASETPRRRLSFRSPLKNRLRNTAKICAQTR